MGHFIMTDKAERKTLPCAYPGCEHTVEVTKFFTPSKARCPEHQDKPTSTMRALVSAPVGGSVDLEPPKPNQSLADLRCPIDDVSLEIVRIDDSMGWLTMKCPECYTAIEIKPKWSPMIIRSIPEHLRVLVEAFNDTQRNLQAKHERVMVGNFKSYPNGEGDAVWDAELAGQRDIQNLEDLILDATTFKFGTVVQIFEPTEGDMPKEESTNEDEARGT